MVFEGRDYIALVNCDVGDHEAYDGDGDDGDDGDDGNDDVDNCGGCDNERRRRMWPW